VSSGRPPGDPPARPLDFDDDPPDRVWPGDEPAGPAPALDAPPPAPQRRGPGRSSWIAIVLIAILLVYIGANFVRNRDAGPGSRGPAVGTRAHPFAAPLATSSLEGSVNVATKPNQGQAGKVPACTVTVPGSVNACRLWRRGPVVVVFFATRGGRCVDELDTVARVAPAHPDVTFLAVALRGGRGDVAGLVRSHRWRFPVAYDEDGRLANLYGVAVCPQLTYVRRGGTVAGTNVGELSQQELEAQVAELEAGRRVG
jgi:hypothetical protein